MPVFTATPHADGDVHTNSAFNTNMAGFRTWVNGLVDTDFTTSTIRSEHLVRPVIGGWPNNSVESTFQGVWWFGYGNLSAAQGGIQVGWWGRNPKRLTIYPWQVSINQPWPLPIGKTIYIPNARHIEINLSFDYLTNGLNPEYPSGVGTGERAGRFIVTRRNRASGVISTSQLSEAYVYPSKPPASNLRAESNAQMMMSEALGAGHYDFWVAYERTATTDTLGLYQIDVARVIGKIEAF